MSIVALVFEHRDGVTGRISCTRDQSPSPVTFLNLPYVQVLSLSRVNERKHALL